MVKTRCSISPAFENYFIKPLIAIVLIFMSSCDAPNPPPSIIKIDEKRVFVEMDTSMGSIELELYADKAPVTVGNFISRVREHFYDGMIFHRVVKDYVIQGGAFTTGLRLKEAHGPIRNEAGNGLMNDTGSIAMARTSNSDSASAEFYINAADNDFLNHLGGTPQKFGYCVFGKVIAGMDVVNKINTVKTGKAKGGIQGRDAAMGDVPVEEVMIKSVRERVKAKLKTN